MAGRMEDILMGSDSDSDAEDGKVGDADVQITVAAPAGNDTSSKSELTNRLKNLYSPPKVSSAAPPPPAVRTIPPNLPRSGAGGPSSSRNPNYVPHMVHNQHHHNAPPASSQQHMQQSQHHPGSLQQQQQPLVGVGRVPAPLPKARNSSRAAPPPPNRMAAVPISTIPPSPMTASSVPTRQPYVTTTQSHPRQAPGGGGGDGSRSHGVVHQQQPNSKDHSAKSSHTSRSSGQSLAQTEEERNNEKEKFLMFTRVLMKYLEQKDPELHLTAKSAIRECYELNKRGGDPAYKSLTHSMRSRLRECVGESYWKKAEDYLAHFFRQKQMRNLEGLESSQPHPPQPQHVPPPQNHPHNPPPPPPQQQQQQHPPPQHHQQLVGPPSNVRTSSQHSTMQQPQPPHQQMIPQQQKIPIQQTPALSKQQVDAAQKKKEKEDVAKKRREQRNANAKAKRAAAKKAKEAALQGTGMPSGGATLPLGGVSGPTVLSTTASVSSMGSKKAVDPKKKKKTVTKPSVTKKKKAEASYKFKDNVDHAFLIDAKSIPNILSKDHRLDLNLDEEQRILLYGDQRQREKVRAITDAAVNVLSTGMVDETLTEAGITPLPWRLPAVYEGWGERNLVSVRTAWSKIRLPESELQHMESEQREAEKLQRVKSIVETEADVQTSAERLKPIEGLATTRLEDDTTNHFWHNEIRAEQDPTLALLSEATEVYLKEAIEKAICKARLRQNLDGVRLWHTLHSFHADPSSTNGKQPHALIRLGCDVRRQVALADGNAAKIYQRMEEAIGRDNDTFHFKPEDPEKMVLEATSMADLSRKPPLKSAAFDADSEAKRRFDVFAGKDIQEPPFGRVPKKAKVILTDLSVEALANQTPVIRARRRLLLGGW